jgi:hypothetical protein
VEEGSCDFGRRQRARISFRGGKFRGLKLGGCELGLWRIYVKFCFKPGLADVDFANPREAHEIGFEGVDRELRFRFLFATLVSYSSD